MGREEDEVRHRAICVLSFLWYHRNLQILQGRSSIPIEPVASAFSFLSNWDGDQLVHNSGDGQEIRLCQVPQYNRKKCNLDASVVRNSRKTAFGAVVRDSKGVFLAGFTGYFSHVFYPSMAEILTSREVLEWLSGEERNSLDIKMDFKVCATAVNSGEDSISEFGQA